MVAGTILIIAKMIWYPSVVMYASGATTIFLMIILVDAGLGPLLTLIAYRPGKSEKALKIDFSIIVVLQLIALAYGSWTLAGGRPVYYVFSVDRFELVQANEIPREFLEDGLAGKYANLPLMGPDWVYAVLPEDSDEQAQLLTNQIAHGVDLAQTPKYYKPLSEGTAVMREKLRPLSDLETINSEQELKSKFKPANILERADFGYFPLSTKKKDMTVILDKASLDVVAIVDLNPWVRD